MKEKLTITQLIAERKTTLEKIESIVDDQFKVDGFYIASTPFFGARTAEEEEKKIKSDIQSVSDLLKRWNAINRARIKANATTKVTVKEFKTPLEIFNGEEPKDEEITIAEAIQRKKWYKEIIGPLYYKLVVARGNEDINKSGLENKAEASIKEELEQKFPATANRNWSQESINKEREALEKKYEVKRVDPFNVVSSDSIEALMDAINAYISHIDIALSIVNAKTEVEFEY